MEIAGIGPGPHACMILADLGATVIRIDRPGGQKFSGGHLNLMARGRPSVALDLKHPEAVAAVLDLISSADALVEGMRPGVAERLGVGPDACLKRNPRLVYGRMTGWGQDGPLAMAAGHDITYLATAGVLYGLGQDPARPHFPTNLLGDFGGGSTYLALGVLAGILHARLSGAGQVIDAAIVDGSQHLSTLLWGLFAAGTTREDRASHLLDGGRPFYDVYATSDHRHVAVGALEPQFFSRLVDRLGIAQECPPQHDESRWGEMRTLLAERFASQPMSHWASIFEGSDACVAPVLTPTEAARHPHLVARRTLVEHHGVVQPAPAPRFSITPTELGAPPAPEPGAHTVQALAAWGIDARPLLASGAAVQA